MLICVYGRGWVQLEGEPAHELKVGEVFNIPPNVKEPLHKRWVICYN